MTSHWFWNLIEIAQFENIPNWFCWQYYFRLVSFVVVWNKWRLFCSTRSYLMATWTICLNMRLPQSRVEKNGSSIYGSMILQLKGNKKWFNILNLSSIISTEDMREWKIWISILSSEKAESFWIQLSFSVNNFFAVLKKLKSQIWTRPYEGWEAPKRASTTG